MPVAEKDLQHRPRLGLAGAIALLIGAVQSGFVLDDVLPGILIGLAGFLVWMLYLGATGMRLLRLGLPGDAAALADAPTPVGVRQP